MQGNFKIISINISEKRGVVKHPVSEAELVKGMGIKDDAHFGPGIRQISFLAYEDFKETAKAMKAQGIELKYGDFAENVLTEGVDLPSLPLGTEFRIGDAVLKVSKIGKECHNGCMIKEITGDCIMPTRGIFAEVIKGGVINNESSCSYSF